MQDNIEEVNKFKQAMANYPTGVSVVTSVDKDSRPFGITVSSFASVSLEPLLILWSIDNNASTYDQFMETSQFAVNILAEDQAEVAATFASSEGDRFSNCDWQLSPHKLPVITGAMATLECKVFKKVEAGDHIIFIGEIIDMQVTKKTPLLYHNRKLAALPSVFHEA